MPTTAASRIRSYLDSHPEAMEQLNGKYKVSANAIARACNCKSQMVHQMRHVLKNKKGIKTVASARTSPRSVELEELIEVTHLCNKLGTGKVFTIVRSLKNMGVK